MKQTIEKILVVGPSWVGDMVMAQSLFMTLKQDRPQCQIDVLAPQWSFSLLERMPEVEQAIAMPLGHGKLELKIRFDLGKRLREAHYDQAILLPNSWKSALIPYFANIPQRTGYRGEMRYGLLNDVRELDKNVLKQTVQRYVSHAFKNKPLNPPKIPFPVLQVKKDNQVFLLKELSLNLDRLVVCMMPGAEYGPAKQWPVDYYAELAKKLVLAGSQVWVMGSENDKLTGDRLVDSGNEYIVNLCGRTKLVDTVDLLACADSVVTNDSGLMHVAAAVGVKVNAIYGSSTPDYTPPLLEDKNIFYLNIDCSPCFKRICPLGHTDCLTKIKYDDVFRKIIS